MLFHCIIRFFINLIVGSLTKYIDIEKRIYFFIFYLSQLIIKKLLDNHVSKIYLLSKQFSRILLVKAYRRYLKLKRYIVLATTKSDFSGKIFCIGYQKTGTTTLGRSLEMLGYHHSSYDNEIYTKYYKHKLNLPKILEYTSKFESFDDQPWFKVDLIPVLDRKFPNSKFIYLTRDEESWKNSMHNWGKKKWGEYPNVDEGLEGLLNTASLLWNISRVD